MRASPLVRVPTIFPVDRLSSLHIRRHAEDFVANGTGRVQLVVELVEMG